MNREANYSLRSPFFFYYDGRFVSSGTPGKDYKKWAQRRGVDDTDGKVPFRLNGACVPVSPGVSRLILLWTRKPGAKQNLMGKLTSSWVGHLFSNKFLDSDLAFLHFQERILRRKSPNPDNWKA